MIGHKSITCDECGTVHEAVTFAYAVWETMKAGWKYLATKHKKISKHICPDCQPKFWWNND